MTSFRKQPCPCGSGKRYKHCCGKLNSPANKKSEQDLVSIKITNNLQIFAPNSLNQITPYILREQEEWFEDEFQFVNKYIQLGMRVIDIGANYGVYSLLIANNIGKSGHLWSFEPTTATMLALQKSIKENSLNNITAIQTALSNRTGTATLSIGTDAVFNSINSLTEGPVEEVPVSTINQCAENYKWEKIDFIKLDAEGEEENIINGGLEFFKKESPLIMFEIKHGSTVNNNLVNKFRECDYNTYRLIPGLNILVPFSISENIDNFQLNLFCCKNDRSNMLRKMNMLVTDSGKLIPENNLQHSQWLHDIANMPFAKDIWPNIKDSDFLKKGKNTARYHKALEFYMLSTNKNYTISERYSALINTYNMLNDLAVGATNIAHLCMLTRVAGELGYREHAVSTLGTLLIETKDNQNIVFNEPFLPIVKRFEHIPVKQQPQNWLLASLFEYRELRKNFSSFYSNKYVSLTNLEMVKNLGYHSPEIERRIQLLRMRTGEQPGPICHDILKDYSEHNLNPDYWCGTS